MINSHLELTVRPFLMNVCIHPGSFPENSKIVFLKRCLREEQCKTTSQHFTELCLFISENFLIYLNILILRWGREENYLTANVSRSLLINMWPAQASSVGITEKFLKMQNLHPYSRPTES